MSDIKFNWTIKVPNTTIIGLQKIISDIGDSFLRVEKGSFSELSASVMKKFYQSRVVTRAKYESGKGGDSGQGVDAGVSLTASAMSAINDPALYVHQSSRPNKNRTIVAMGHGLFPRVALRPRERRGQLAEYARRVGWERGSYASYSYLTEDALHIREYGTGSRSKDPGHYRSSNYVHGINLYGRGKNIRFDTILGMIEYFQSKDKKSKTKSKSTSTAMKDDRKHLEVKDTKYHIERLLSTENVMKIEGVEFRTRKSKTQLEQDRAEANAYLSPKQGELVRRLANKQIPDRNDRRDLQVSSDLPDSSPFAKLEREQREKAQTAIEDRAIDLYESMARQFRDPSMAGAPHKWARQTNVHGNPMLLKHPGIKPYNWFTDIQGGMHDEDFRYIRGKVFSYAVIPFLKAQAVKHGTK